MVFGRLAARVGEDLDVLDFDDDGAALASTETVADGGLSVASVINVIRRSKVR